MDCVFFSRTSGLIVARDPHHKQNLYWENIVHENVAVYQVCKEAMESQGFKLLAIILDGRRGVRELFSDIPVQMCHFHQKQIMIRYLTTRPRLAASIELLEIVRTLTTAREIDFQKALDSWHQRWEAFLKERTVDTETKRWRYTHRRLRSAYRSLQTNLPFLFTYQRFPELKIPNTTNSLEGFFFRFKELLRVHRGANANLKQKIITEILGC